MGVHKMMLLIMVLFSFCSPTLFAQVNKNSTPDDTHESMGSNGTSENNCTVHNGRGMVNQNKYTNDITSGNRNGRTSSYPQKAGNGMIPVYAAGAAGKRRNHKVAAATDTPYWKGKLTVLIAIATASFLLS